MLLQCQVKCLLHPGVFPHHVGQDGWSVVQGLRASHLFQVVAKRGKCLRPHIGTTRLEGMGTVFDCRRIPRSDGCLQGVEYGGGWS